MSISSIHPDHSHSITIVAGIHYMIGECVVICLPVSQVFASMALCHLRGIDSSMEQGFKGMTRDIETSTQHLYFYFLFSHTTQE